jgi:hypothetical protein
VPTQLIVFAHLGAPLRPHDLWTAWTFEPVTIAALLLSLWLYTRGLERLWHAAGKGRGVRRREAWAFAAGWTLLALALLSPLHALAGVLLAERSGPDDRYSERFRHVASLTAKPNVSKSV